MDLRMKKTRLQIMNAYMALREKLMPEKIKVKDICEMAMINKTTFYKHYTDSIELCNEIEDNAIDRVVASFTERDRIFETPKGYITGLLAALDKESSNLKVVFRGKQELLCAKLEERLSRFYEGKLQNDDDKLRLSFAIGGFVRVAKDYIFSEKKMNMQKILESTTRMLDSLLKRQEPSKAPAQN
jgi:AcrR family transcriptional regulator